MILSNFATSYIGEARSTSRLSRNETMSISMKVSNVHFLQGL